MRLTGISKTKRGLIALFIDGEFLCSVHPELFELAGLSVGAELEEDTLEELRGQTTERLAREKALSLLSYKEYTTGELRERLRRAVKDTDAADAAVDRMGELGLLDDADYAVRYARDLSVRKQFGIWRIRQEMRRKGLSEEAVALGIGMLADEDIPQKIRGLLERKYPGFAEDEKVRRRAFAAMVRLGYESGDIRRAMEIELDA